MIKEIFDVVKKHGGEAILTLKKHKNGTERIFEVAKKFKPNYVVDVQGDEPFVDPKDIDRVINFHKKNRNLILLSQVCWLNTTLQVEI